MKKCMLILLLTYWSQSLLAATALLHRFAEPEAANLVSLPTPVWKGYVINLKTSYDRQELISKSFSEKPWFADKFCFFDGVDGRDPSYAQSFVVANVTAYQPNAKKPQERLNVWACGQSHLEVWKTVVSDPTIDFAVIAEDDVAYFHPRFDDLFAEAIQHFSQFGMLYLGTSRDHQVDGALSRDFNQSEPQLLRWGEGQRIMAMSMYAITPKAASIALDLIGRDASRIDGKLNEFVFPHLLQGGLTVEFFDPPIVARDFMVKSFLGHDEGCLGVECEQFLEITPKPSGAVERCPAPEYTKLLKGSWQP